MKLFIAPNSAVTFDSAMGYKNNPQLVQNQAADFSFAPDLHQICTKRVLFFPHQMIIPRPVSLPLPCQQLGMEEMDEVGQQQVGLAL